jgi:hypothetical protein
MRIINNDCYNNDELCIAFNKKDRNILYFSIRKTLEYFDENHSEAIKLLHTIILFNENKGDSENGYF